jgi:hypothetical protein
MEGVDVGLEDAVLFDFILLFRSDTFDFFIFNFFFGFAVEWEGMFDLLELILVWYYLLNNI